MYNKYAFNLTNTFFLNRLLYKLFQIAKTLCFYISFLLMHIHHKDNCTYNLSLIHIQMCIRDSFYSQPAKPSTFTQRTHSMDTHNSHLSVYSLPYRSISMLAVVNPNCHYSLSAEGYQCKPTEIICMGKPTIPSSKIKVGRT